MAQQFINIGTSANKGDGEPLRTAFDKINDNFTEVYGDIQALKSGAIVADVKGTIVGDDSTILVDGVNSSINLAGTVKGDIVPDTNVAYDIGSATKRFKDLYLSGNTINLGGTALSITAGKLQVGGTDVGSTISFSELTNKPTTIAGYGITDAFDGDYNSLSNKPTIPTDISQLADLTNILFDGDYNSLNNKPTLPAGYTDSDVDTHLNTSTANNNEVLSWTGEDYAWVAQSGGGGGITDVVSDTTPKLGGDLDLNSNNITGTGNINITGTLALGGNDVSGVGNIGAGTLNNHTIPGGSAGTLALLSDIPAGGGGATDLNGLTDVIITNPVFRQVLMYDSGSWYNTSYRLNDLSNVNVNFPSNGEVLTWSESGQQWFPQPIPGGSPTSNSVNITVSYAGGVTPSAGVGISEPETVGVGNGTDIWAVTGSSPVQLTDDIQTNLLDLDVTSSENKRAKLDYGLASMVFGGGREGKLLMCTNRNTTYTITIDYQNFLTFPATYKTVVVAPQGSATFMVGYGMWTLIAND